MRSMVVAMMCLSAVCAAAPIQAAPIQAAPIQAAPIQASLAQAAPARDSRTADLVRRTLEAGARGECPEGLMEPPLRRKCLDQMPGIETDLSRLGPIAGIERLGSRKDRRLGEITIYRVRFAHGRMVWVARTAPEGRLAVLEAPN